MLAILNADVVATGQDEYGLAPMIAAHFFEHTLDCIFVALLTYGVYGLLGSPRRSAGERAAWPDRIRAALRQAIRLEALCTQVGPPPIR